jgi:TRAP-type mannitol/chloroaromatic compound transport system substrate-binding protein
MKRVKLLVALVVTIVVVLGLGSTVFAKTIKWRMPTAWPKGTYLQWGSEFFAKTVKEMSGGRLQITTYPGGAIMPAFEIFDAVVAGTVEAAHGTSGYWIGKEPAAPLFSTIPMGFTAMPYLAWFYEGDGLELMREMYAKYNFGFVGPCGIMPPEDFAWSHKPITKLEDFKGLKFRTVAFWGEILSGMGASVVTLPGAEVYPALQRKVLDAAEYSLPNIDRDLGFHEICKYLAVPGIHQPSTVQDLYVNKRAWDKLTPDLQAIVKYAAQVTSLRTFIRGIWLDAPALEQFKEYGTKIHYLDPKVQQQMVEIAEKFFDKKAAKDPFFAKVVKSQRRWAKTHKVYRDLMMPQF